MSIQTQKTKKLVTSAVLIAMSVALSLITVFRMPWGGSITPFSMLPVMIIGYIYGTSWGLVGAFSFALLQMIIGVAATQAFAGVHGVNVVLMALLDYIVAFTVLGLTGLFRKIKRKSLGFILGVAVTGLLRYIMHVVSGILLWGAYATSFFENSDEGGFSSFFPALSSEILSSTSGNLLATIYSLIYNGLYMIPEILLCIIGAVALVKLLPKQYFDNK